MICNAKHTLDATEGKTCQLLAGLRSETKGKCKKERFKGKQKHAGQMRNA